MNVCFHFSLFFWSLSCALFFYRPQFKRCECLCLCMCQRWKEATECVYVCVYMFFVCRSMCVEVEEVYRFNDGKSSTVTTLHIPYMCLFVYVCQCVCVRACVCVCVCVRVCV